MAKSMCSLLFPGSVSLLLLFSVQAGRLDEISNVGQNELEAVRLAEISQITQKAGLEERISCKPVFQCLGTQPNDTIVKPGTCRCEDEKAQGGKANCKLWGTSWRSCKFPTTSEFEEIGQNDFFDISRAAPSGHLQGVSDMSSDIKQKVLSEGVRILSDLDDTLVCSGGRVPHGIDTRCTHGTFYDGAAELFYALSVKTPNDFRWGESVAWRPIPFSARPSKLSYFLGMSACSSVDLHFKKRICNCSGKAACRAGMCNCFGLDILNAQYGRLRDTTDLWENTGQMRNMGATKFKSWMSIHENLEAPAVFFGDNGQGDLLAAQRMLIASQGAWRQGGKDFSGRVVAAFIHDVARNCTTLQCRSTWVKHNIFFFADYCEAANQAERVGLLLPHQASGVRSRILGCVAAITTSTTTISTTITTTTITTDQ